jgi:hypothetical protein
LRIDELEKVLGGRGIARAPIAEKNRDFSRFWHVDGTLPGSIDNSEAFGCNKIN